MLLVVWLLSVASSFTALALYKGTPSEFGATPLHFPSASRIVRSPERFTLIMFVHPRCACSRASLAELERFLGAQRADLEVTVMVRSESVLDPALENAALTQRARSIAGVHVRFDVGGVEAARFGAASSGHTVLYAADGDLRFSGGLTNSRGHEGKSLGQAYLAAVLNDAATPASTERRAAPVFGCGLQEGKAEQ